MAAVCPVCGARIWWSFDLDRAVCVRCDWVDDADTVSIESVDRGYGRGDDDDGGGC